MPQAVLGLPNMVREPSVVRVTYNLQEISDFEPSRLERGQTGISRPHAGTFRTFQCVQPCQAGRVARRGARIHARALSRRPIGTRSLLLMADLSVLPSTLRREPIRLLYWTAHLRQDKATSTGPAKGII